MTLLPLNLRIKIQFNGSQGRDPASKRDAEGANLEYAKPGESLRQKDPAPIKLWKVRSSSVALVRNDTDGVKLVRLIVK